jgi:uncharacterized protein
MATEKTFSIPHIGLKKTVHELNYHLDQAFFNKHENALISGADINVKVLFDKSSTPYILDFYISGTFETECDKCAADVRISLSGEYRVFVKFDAEAEIPVDENLEILFLSREEPEINIEPYLYDFVCLSLPYTKICDDPGNTPYCDMEVVALLDRINEQEEEKTTDPRWEGLNKLKDLN